MKIRKLFGAGKLEAVVLAFAALVPAVHVRSQPPHTAPSRGDAPPRSQQPDVCEALRGNPLKCRGYLFSVSPDEEWIAVILDLSARDLRVRVLHRRSQKTWDASLSDYPLDGFPDCFSRDGRQMVLTGKVADLSASMRALEFTDRPRESAPPCTLLGFPAIVADQAVEFGTVTTNNEGIRYESVTEGKEETSVLRISGKSCRVDFSPVLDADRERLNAAAAKLPPELAGVLKDTSTRPAIVRLGQLSASPDGKCLAAIATIFRGQVGFAGMPCGVLVPLDRGELVAYPFAQHVYGKILWSSDSKAVYYYAQPQGGSGNGTVHRQVVAGMLLPGRTPAQPPRPGR